MSESTPNGHPNPNINLYEYIREDFVGLLDGVVIEGETLTHTEKQLILGLFDHSAARAMVRYARELGLDIV